ncbi:borealin-like [Periplaneta americana]|uniref:borealin-like n=1 Tax=Periplaneta americana TaxID=6978 RepID=UPI0037E7C83E
MPAKKRSRRGRTTASVKSEDSITSENENVNRPTWVEDFDVELKNKLAIWDELLQKKLQSLEKQYAIAKGTISRTTGNMTLKELRARTNQKTAETKSDSSNAARVKFHSHLRKRSSSVPVIHPKETSPLACSNSLSTAKTKGVVGKFKAPATSVTNSTLSLITPKVAPNAPLSILRHPRQGELAVSLSGSPLIVTSMLAEQRANVNVPLPDGRVLSILPEPGLRPYEVPCLDDDTKRELETLQKHINTFINWSKK